MQKCYVKNVLRVAKSSIPKIGNATTKVACAANAQDEWGLVNEITVLYFFYPSNKHHPNPTQKMKLLLSSLACLWGLAT